MILALNHVQISIPVGGEDEARKFYCDLLGIKEIPKPAELKSSGGLWLELGMVQLHMGAENGVNRRATRAHLAYEVKELKSWKKKLTEKGFMVKDSAPVPGFARMELRDPFGNRIEMLAKN